MYHDFPLSKWLHGFLYPYIWKNKDPNVTMKLGVKRILWNCLNPLPSAFGQDYTILRHLFTSLLAKVLENYVGVACNFTIGEQNWRHF
jgi:hypothetical protein